VGFARDFVFQYGGPLRGKQGRPPKIGAGPDLRPAEIPKNPSGGANSGSTPGKSVSTGCATRAFHGEDAGALPQPRSVADAFLALAVAGVQPRQRGEVTLAVFQANSVTRRAAKLRTSSAVRGG